MPQKRFIVTEALNANHAPIKQMMEGDQILKMRCCLRPLSCRALFHMRAKPTHTSMSSVFKPANCPGPMPHAKTNISFSPALSCMLLANEGDEQQQLVLQQE